jgi:hypothetical protein
LLLVTGLLQASSGQTMDLGTAEPVFQQLSYGLDEGAEAGRATAVKAIRGRGRRLDQIRAGGGS